MVNHINCKKMTLHICDDYALRYHNNSIKNNIMCKYRLPDHKHLGWTDIDIPCINQLINTWNDCVFHFRLHRNIQGHGNSP